MVESIIAALIGGLVFGLLIWIIAKLGLGIEVDSYWWAVIAGLLISAFSNLAATIIPDVSGIVGAIISLVVAALIIMLSDKILKGMRAKGFVGALVAAIAISVVQFVVLTLIVTAAA